MNVLSAAGNDAERPTERVQDFRWVLRQSTHEQHAQLDALISTLDLTRSDTLARFMAIHLMCFEAMACHYDDPVLHGLIQGLRQDLNALGKPQDASATVELQPFHPLAARYILAGSRMGTGVLRKQWLKATEVTVRAASAYFTSPNDRSEWPAVCAELSKIDCGSDLAQEISADAAGIFDIFAEAFHRSAPPVPACATPQPDPAANR